MLVFLFRSFRITVKEALERILSKVAENVQSPFLLLTRKDSSLGVEGYIWYHLFVISSTIQVVWWYTATVSDHWILCPLLPAPTSSLAILLGLLWRSRLKGS